ncbi:hypothetical protein G9A89_003507 [Geosiphon pyriformis]|nr:hypothetical protein G9A89_003507 [Geosiphon pyriformis]
MSKSTNKGSWSPEEDRGLIELIKKRGQNYAKIQEEMNNSRHYLDANQSLTDDEKTKVLFYASKYNRRWKEIAKLFPGRSELTIKNCFWTHQRVKGKVKNPINRMSIDYILNRRE